MALTNAAAEPLSLDPLYRPAPISRRPTHALLLDVTSAGEQRLVAVGERGRVLLSTDDGRSWTQSAVPVSVTLAAVDFPTADNGWAVGHGGIVLHSRDGGATWERQLDGVQAAQIELDAALGEPDQSDSRVMRRLSLARQLVADGPDKPFLDVHFFDDKRGIIVGAYGLIYSTDDGGVHWRSLQGAIDNPGGKHLYRILERASNVYIVGEQGAVFASTDGGRRFTAFESPYVGTFFGAQDSAASGSLILYGLRGNAFRTTDGGRRWQRVEIGDAASFTASTVLGDGRMVLADEAGHVFVSTDGGRSFMSVPIDRPVAVNAIAQTHDGSLVLAGARGVARLSLSNDRQAIAQ